MATQQATPLRMAVLWAGDPTAPAPRRESTRLRRIFEELELRGVQAEPAVYADEVADAVREQLRQLDGVLVWVDPIVNGRNRSVLDAMLRSVAAEGVFVSAHPDVILSMGTKEVLYQTRDMPWGTDTYLYRSFDELRDQFPPLLRSSGPRVLKQHRGNGGNGVWKVELVHASEARVRVQHAVRGAVVEELRVGEFLERCRPYFEGTGCIIDQPYQPRLADGMVRCYLVHDGVVGFGHQFVTALLPPLPGELAPPDPAPRLYYGPSRPEFQRLKAQLESDWVPEMQRVLGIERDSLPVIWDADFLLGPKTQSGEDSYVLCEINVSSVFPIPEEAPAPLAEAAIERALAARRARSA